jgi:hypothetical protein
MTGHEPADRTAYELAAAERAGFTGAIYGPAAFNPCDDRGVRQVFIYRRGACTDRYVTTVGRQDPDPPAHYGHYTVPGNTDGQEPSHSESLGTSTRNPAGPELPATPNTSTGMPEAPGSWTHSALPATTAQENYATRNALVAAYCDAYDQARAIALQACE